MFHYHYSHICLRCYISAPPTAKLIPAAERMDYIASPQTISSVPPSVPLQRVHSTPAATSIHYSVADAVVAANQGRADRPNITPSTSNDASIPPWLVPFLGHPNSEPVPWESSISPNNIEQSGQYFQSQGNEMFNPTGFPSLPNPIQNAWMSNPLYPDALMSTTPPYIPDNAFAGLNDDQNYLQIFTHPPIREASTAFACPFYSSNNTDSGIQPSYSAEYVQSPRDTV